MNMVHDHRGRLFTALAILAAALGAGCSSKSPDPTNAPDVTFSAGPYTVDAGSELVMCSYVRGTNMAATDVRAFQTQQTPGAHHLIVYTASEAIDLPPN